VARRRGLGGTPSTSPVACRDTKSRGGSWRVGTVVVPAERWWLAGSFDAGVVVGCRHLPCALSKLFIWPCAGCLLVDRVRRQARPSEGKAKLPQRAARSAA
jgi:hypothetical protein